MRARILIAAACMVWLAGAAVAAVPPPGWSLVPGSAPPGAVLAPPIPATDVQLVLDDDSAEADFGAGAATAEQFLWFQQFAWPGSNFDLEEVWVLFRPGPNMAVGEDIQLAVYSDPDSDPTNGADLLATFDETIQELDGVTFSVYSLSPPVPVTTEGDILLGVVSRFVESGVTPPTRPATLDTTASQGSSWLAIWTGDPPALPTLPPDLFLDRIDFVQPGNWMIRGFGSLRPVMEIPTLGGAGLAALVGLLGLVGLWISRKAR